MKIQNGNILDFIGIADIVCVTTNGIVKNNGELVMGGGCAKSFKDRIPNLPTILGEKVKLKGNICLVAGSIENTYIVSFPTKHHYKDNSDLDLIIQSAKRIVQIADYYKAQKIYIPSPGTGLGNLPKEVVYKALESILDDRFVLIEL